MRSVRALLSSMCRFAVDPVRLTIRSSRSPSTAPKPAPVTALQLLSYITVALLLQVVAGAAFALWRRRATAGALAPVGVEEGVASAGLPSGAWSGWRDFRVVRRAFEDVAQTQCSFHLQPVDGAPLQPFQPGQYLTGRANAARASERKIERPPRPLLRYPR